MVATTAPVKEENGGDRWVVRDVARVMSVAPVALYTILPLPMWYGVWHTKERSGGGAFTLRNIVQQLCNSVVNAGGGGNYRMIDSCTKAPKCTKAQK